MAEPPGDEPAGEWVMDVASPRIQAIRAEHARGVSMAEIGRKLGLSRQRVSQILRKAPVRRRRPPHVAEAKAARAQAQAAREAEWAATLSARWEEVRARVEARRQRQSRAAE
jgi:transcriptional regulator with XRE-family HTH domain